MIKVAIDFRLARQGGAGRYVRTLLEGLAVSPSGLEVTAFGPERHRDLLGECATGAIRYVPFETAPFTFREQATVPGLVRRLGSDVLHVPYYNFPLACPIPVVVTVHDLVWFHPEHVQAWRPAAVYSRFMIGQAMRRAAALIAVSETAGQEVIERFPRRKGLVDVTPNGLSLTVHKALGEASGEVRDLSQSLYVGTFKPAKHVGILLHAVAILRNRGVRVSVVLGGTPGRNRNQDMRGLASELRIEDQVRVTGPVSERELATLYMQSGMYVMPSEYEGFGLTTLEAMAAGCAIIAADMPVHREVAGEGAVYFRRSDPEDLASKLQVLVADPAARSRLAAKGLARAGRFSAETLGRLSADVYRRVAREASG